MSVMAGGGGSRELALSLLAAANNHGDLAVKFSSLKQVKDILLSAEPSLAAELFRYLVELQSSPESLVRKFLIEVMEEVGLKVMEHASVLIPVLLSFVKDSDSIVVRQSIVSGTILFRSILEEMAMQFHRRGRIEKWLNELWTGMVKFKDAVFAIALEPGSVGTKLLALKFLETCVLLFIPDSDDSEKSVPEVLDPVALTSEANRIIGALLNLLRSANILPGSLTISVVNCLAAIARKRPLYYGTILSALLDFDPNFKMVKGGHAASVQYSLRTAFLGFLRCTYPSIVESRDRLLRALREMNAGDAADQVIRQVDKLIKSTERASRDARLAKDDQLSIQPPSAGDALRKRSILQDTEEPTDTELASKRLCYSPASHVASTNERSDYGQDNYFVNGVSALAPLSKTDSSPVEQMIAMMGAFTREGEKGAQSLELLLSTIQPDLLADIVITNMKHLPKTPPPLVRIRKSPTSHQTTSSGSPASDMAPSVTSNYPVLSAQMPSTAATVTCASLFETSSTNNLPLDSKRDPRRDPRRMDPRRQAEPIGVPSVNMMEDSSVMQPETDGSISLTKHLSLPEIASAENSTVFLTSKASDIDKMLESQIDYAIDHLTPREEVLDGIKGTVPVPEVDATSDLAPSLVSRNDEGSVALTSENFYVTDGVDISSSQESDQHSPAISNTSTIEENCHDLPMLPSYADLTEEQQVIVKKMAFERIIESNKTMSGAGSSGTRMALLARLVAQVDVDCIVVEMLQNHIVSDYQNQKGHELVLHVLYHLHTVMISDSIEKASSAAVTYENFLLTVAKSLLEKLPASDKSFSRLLSEVPLLPESTLKLLEDLCYSDVIDCHGKVVRDGDRITQGLGAVWSLILGRPLNRQACLNIVLKCAVHSQDEIRAKAIRLVANKLYLLSYISENIEQFATKMLLSAVNQHVPDIELSQSGSLNEQKLEGEMESQETFISGSQFSELGTSENDTVKDGENAGQSVNKSIPEAQCFISLYFALSTKKPSLLQLVFDIYGRAPKTVKQAVHRHIPVLIRGLGTSNTELLHIIANPSQGSENLLSLVLQILTEETTPSPDLISTVKYLYETKLKDASILIPMLSSLSKNEVLPIFPRLVNLPLEKFQKALAHILQGSAHTGPALTPAEVLVAIHDIRPEKDGIPLKKITDACSACFEQRMVFTQQVLAKALSQMVDQNPLPLLFMRTVIQAIDAFPPLVDFVMEILSKLVSKQVWKMPKLWVGFLKCVSQTQPHSFHVLLQLPSPQLESALTKYANLRVPLAAYASQPNIRPSLSRSTLVVLGLANESHIQSSHLTPLHSSDTSSSVHGTTLT